jgi:hypothetical protein
LSVVNTRRVFVYSGLLALLITSTAFAGRYQRTKDGRTRVWNENPKPGDLVTWSGARDAKGYATGFGTVTWFTPQNQVETGSGVAAWLRHIGRQRHYIVTSRESGMMVQGKFEQAPANADPKKKGRTDIFEEQAPSARIEATPKKAQPSPAQEKATSPAPTPSRTPANDSLDSLMHAPSSLKLNPPAGASSLPSSSSPTATPDLSLALTPAPSPSPSPQ